MAIRSLNEIETKIAANVQKELAAKLSEMAQDRYVISSKHIEDYVLQLEVANKRVHDQLLGGGLSLFKANGGRLRLFCTPTIPSYFPYITGQVKDSQGRYMRVVYMNMYGLGEWSLEGDRFLDVSVASDLQSVFVNGMIAVSILQQGAERIFGNTAVMNYLTKIYSFLFYKILSNVAQNDPGQDFEKDLIRFCIGKFFLMYVLKHEESDTVNSIAYNCVKNRSSLSSILSYLENVDIDYSTFSGFLSSVAQEFYHTNVNLNEFANKWLLMYGDATGLAIEYAPYLLYFLIAAKKNARLGGLCAFGSARMTKDLNNEGLDKLYIAVSSLVR